MLSRRKHGSEDQLVFRSNLAWTRQRRKDRLIFGIFASIAEFERELFGIVFDPASLRLARVASA